MKNFKYLLLVLLITQSCSTLKNSQTSQVDVPPVLSPTATPSSVPSAMGGVTFAPDEYYTTKPERELIAKAAKKMNEVVHSDCYFNFMSHRKFIQVDGKTSLQVATEFKNASGTIPVQFYYSRWTSAIAYRQPPGNTIYLNRKFIGAGSDICDVAGTLAHESIGHSLLNYGHDYNWSASREYSAPYSSDHAFANEPYSGSESGGCCK